MILTLGSIAAAQEIGNDDRKIKKMPGKLKGEIIIKEAGGNNLGNFSCANLIVGANRIDAKRPFDWKRQSKATGDFSKRQCSFVIDDIPASGTFVAVISAEFPKGCDLKIIRCDEFISDAVKKRRRSFEIQFYRYENKVRNR